MHKMNILSVLKNIALFINLVFCQIKFALSFLHFPSSYFPVLKGLSSEIDLAGNGIN